MITSCSSFTFELFLIKNKEMEQWDIDDHFIDLYTLVQDKEKCEIIKNYVSDLAEALIKECQGSKKYTISLNIPQEFSMNHHIKYLDITYKILSIEPSTYFLDQVITEKRREIYKKEKEAYEKGEFIAKTEVYGIKCDNEDCGWFDMDVTFEEYPDYVNKPCPCCNENLLTKEEYDLLKNVSDFYKKINDNLMSNLSIEEQEKLREISSYKAYFSKYDYKNLDDMEDYTEDMEKEI